MIRVHTYSPKDEIAAADLNAIQDNALGVAQALGLLNWSGRLRVYGTAAAPSVRVESIAAVALGTGSTWDVFSDEDGDLLGIGNVEGTPASLTADTWYYVYAYTPDGATFGYQISTDPPTESGTVTYLRLWKRGTTPGQYRYLGCFCTDVNGDPIAVNRYANGRYVYSVDTLSTDGAAALYVLNVTPPEAYGGSPDYGTVSCVKGVPPHGKSAKLYFWQSDTSANNLAVMATWGTPPFPHVVTYLGGSGQAYAEVEVYLSGVQTFDYQASVGSGTVQARVLGWEE